MAGSSGSGDEIEAGRTNLAESTTVVAGGRPSELDVPFNGQSAFAAGPRRDDQRPDRTLNGVLGIGWNGSGSPDQLEPGAGVVGVGAPNRGPGMVGLGGGMKVTTFLGSPAALGEDGLGGTGVIGIGGPGDAGLAAAAAPDIAALLPSRPGAGAVGVGGASLFPTPGPQDPDQGIVNGPGLVGIAGGRGRAPGANLSQADLADTANIGVVGFGGDGPKPAAVPGGFVGPKNAGAGVRGVGGVATTPGTAYTVGGPGVVGIAGGAPAPPELYIREMGVVGAAQGGAGVRGLSTRGAGVLGDSLDGAGVDGRSVNGVGVKGTSDRGSAVQGRSVDGAGVAGTSEGNVGGVFSSTTVAQIHLSPHPVPPNRESPTGRIPGNAGDLLALRVPDPTGTTAPTVPSATLWFCQTTGDASSATWVKIA